MKMNVLGIDPSLSNWGMSLCELDIANSAIAVQKLEIVKTEPSKVKQVRRNSDDLERARQLALAMKSMIADNNVRLVFVEVPHGSQSARAMASYGICIGVLASCEAPMFQLSERELKETVLGTHKATKEEMIRKITELHPEGKWPRRKGEIVLSTAEHLADATAAIHAGLNLSEYKRMISWMQSDLKVLSA